jgi:hypothetical protein
MRYIGWNIIQCDWSVRIKKNLEKRKEFGHTNKHVHRRMTDHVSTEQEEKSQKKLNLPTP